MGSAAASGGYPGGDQKQPPQATSDEADEQKASRPRAATESAATASAAPAPAQAHRPSSGLRKTTPNPETGEFDIGPFAKAQSERVVKLNFEANTVHSYTPSDSSEEWDPIAEDDEDSDDAKAPQEIAGHLWKKSPSKFVFCKY